MQASARLKKIERKALRSEVVGDGMKSSRLALKKPLQTTNPLQINELFDERGSVKKKYQGQDGYCRFVKEHFGKETSMSTIFIKVSEILKGTSIQKPDWKMFQGKVFEFEKLLQMVNKKDFIQMYRGQHKGYPVFALEYFNGNMQKAFTNVSAILDKDKFKELDWQQFRGHVEEFKELQAKILKSGGSIKKEYVGQDGYLKFAKEHYNGNMQRAFINVSAVLDKTKFKELDWQQFQGYVKEFKELQGRILKANGSIKKEYVGQDGYLRFAKEYYGGEMPRAFHDVSAVLDKTKFKELGWQCFQGYAEEFKKLRGKILKAGGSIKKEYVGQGGYLRFAKEHWGGNMQKAFRNVSAGLEKNKFKELGWQQFQDFAEEFKKLRGKILKAGGSIKKEYVGQDGYLKFAREHYGGEMLKAFQTVSAVLEKDKFKELGWQCFQGHVEEFKELQRKILKTGGSIKEEYIGKNGYLRFSKEHYSGEMLKAFLTVSAVLEKDKFKELGWQCFQGHMEEFKKLQRKILKAGGSIKKEYVGQDGYLKFAREHYGGEMLKAFQTVSAVLDKAKFKELGWQQFQGSAKKFKELKGKILKAGGSIKREYVGPDGYLKFAKEHWGDNMQKAFQTVSAVLDKAKFKELGWQQFQGSAKKFKELKGKILKSGGSIKEEYIEQDGYLRFAKEHWGGNMQKAFRNVSAVLEKSKFKKLSWQQFPGSVKEFKELKGKILKAGVFIKEEYVEQDGYFKFAKEHYSGEMLKAFQTVSAVLEKSKFKKLSWQQFPGSVKEFKELKRKILKAGGSIKREYIGKNGYLRFAKEHWGGNMQRAFQTVSAVLDKTKFKELGWQCFQGSVEEFKELKGKILKTNGSIKKEYVGQDGYLRFAKEHWGGNMKKAFHNVSAALEKTKFKELGWQFFQGSMKEFLKVTFIG